VAVPDTVTPGSATAQPLPALPDAPLAEVMVEGKEPRFVAPTRLDRIGRIWAPVMIDGKGPFRLVLDTGANHSALTAASARKLGAPSANAATVVTGLTGSAVVPTISVSSMEVGDLLMGPTTLPVVADVFGGAQGVLGNEGFASKRIFADFAHDKLVIARSHDQRAGVGFSVVRLHEMAGGLLIAEARVGGIRCKAVIDTGSQESVGNPALRTALIRHPPRRPPRAEVMGVTLEVQTGEYLQAPNIEIGDLIVRGAHLTFGDMYLFEHWKLADQPVLLLGMDVLGHLDVLIIDYHMHEMQIRLAHDRLPTPD
jgi:predicted aspartyl protease